MLDDPTDPTDPTDATAHNIQVPIYKLRSASLQSHLKFREIASRVFDRLICVIRVRA